MKQFMKRNGIFVTGLALSLLLMVSCSTPAATDAPAASATVTATSAAPEGKVFTVEELAKFDGQNGTPAYIAVDGVVYDVSDVPEWRGGSHQGRFTAGRDLTEEIKTISPHGTSKLKGLPVVGTLAK